MARVLTVNVGRAEPNPLARRGGVSGIGKRPVDGRVAVRAPGPKRGGLGSGIVGDAVCNQRHHGGDDQALYAFAREDLDEWEAGLGRELPNGMFGENLTTAGLDVNAARIGEVWVIGDPIRTDAVRVQVTDPRIPCATFQARMGVRGWVKRFTADGRPGTYLRILAAGTIGAGDPITVVHRPAHDVTVAHAFAALTTQPELLAGLAAAGDDLSAELRATVAAG